MAELREERRVQLQQARDAATKLRDEKGRSEGPDDAETYTVAVVPHMRRPLSPPQAERVDKLREHLEHLVHTAMSQPEAPSDAPYQLSELPADATDVEAVLFSGACRLCRGHCCQTGEEHAFLSVKSIRDYLARVPDATGEDIVEHYVKRVPTYSVVGSCIFHGETGCALPRVMRSDTCNRWLCPGLTDLREALAGGASPRFFIASNGEAGIDAAEFVDATTVTT